MNNCKPGANATITVKRARHTESKVSGAAAVPILYVIDGTDFGGGERVFLQIINGLKRKPGYSIFAATAPQGRYAATLRDSGVFLVGIDLRRHRILFCGGYRFDCRR